MIKTITQHLSDRNFKTIIAFMAGIFLLGLLLGYLISGGGRKTPVASGGKSGAETTERKIAHWKAPMNPMEIYDEPGKSAMGMDLVPVYEDELSGAGRSGSSERKIAHWKAPMNPAEIYDKPGKSAMGMDLVPVYEDELVGGVDISVSPITQQNMGLRTEKVLRKPLTHTIRAFGHLTSDEGKTAQVSAKTSGWIERLYVDFNGKFVNQGDPLFEIYSPEIVAAQEELLSGTRSKTIGRLLSSAEKRLRYFDVGQEEIDALKREKKARKAMLIRSPIKGYVIAKHIEEGTFVKSGAMIFRIADLSRMWVEAHVYEYELPFIRKGLQAIMTLPYLPGETFTGKVTYVYPFVQPKTRDVVIRLEFDNPDLALKPDMYATILIHSDLEEKGMAIPKEAIIRSGERNTVFMTRDNATFIPREVTLGPSLNNGKVQVITGLAPGDVIVTSGQFLLDSESKLKEAVRKMMDAKREKAAPLDATPADDGFFDELESENDDFFEELETKSDDDFFKDLETFDPNEKGHTP